MKKIILTLICLTMLLSSCSTYTASGAVVGGEFGHVIGSAIGGITGGWRGHHVGALIGTVGGAVTGAAIGSAVEHSANNERAERHHRRIDRNDGQNEIYHGQNDCLKSEQPLLLHNAAIYDSDHNGVLTRGEECTVSFEILNTSPYTIYDVYPIVEDVTGNRHVQVSPNLRVESIAPYRGIRYTATILADRKLKDGEIIVRLGVAQGKRLIDSQTREFSIPTRKR